MKVADAMIDQVDKGKVRALELTRRRHPYTQDVPRRADPSEDGTSGP